MKKHSFLFLFAVITIMSAIGQSSYQFFTQEKVSFQMHQQPGLKRIDARIYGRLSADYSFVLNNSKLIISVFSMKIYDRTEKKEDEWLSREEAERRWVSEFEKVLANIFDVDFSTAIKQNLPSKETLLANNSDFGINYSFVDKGKKYSIYAYLKCFDGLVFIIYESNSDEDIRKNSKVANDIFEFNYRK